MLAVPRDIDIKLDDLIDDIFKRSKKLDLAFKSLLFLNF